jgi:hypothetical protein
MPKVECEVCIHYGCLTPEERPPFVAALARVAAERPYLGGAVTGVGPRPDGRGPLWLNTPDVEAHIGRGGSWAHIHPRGYHDQEIGDAIQLLGRNIAAARR